MIHSIQKCIVVNYMLSHIVHFSIFAHILRVMIQYNPDNGQPYWVYSLSGNLGHVNMIALPTTIPDTPTLYNITDKSPTVEIVKLETTFTLSLYYRLMKSSGKTFPVQ